MSKSGNDSSDAIESYFKFKLHKTLDGKLLWILLLNTILVFK